MRSLPNRRVRPLASCVVLLFTLPVVAGCASIASAPTANSPAVVSGEWEGRFTVGAGGVGGFRMTLQQAGATVTGNVAGPTFCGPAGPLTGVVTATNLKWTAGCLSGAFWVTGDTMTGRITSAVIYEATATRKK